MALGCDAPLLERSCAGEAVGLCVAYEHAEVRAASLEPSELPIADFTRTARIRLELARCPMAPAPHVVDLAAIVPDPSPADGGSGVPVRVTHLLTLEDGAGGDTAGEGAIDVEVTNPLLPTLPAETDITLRFTPRSTAVAGCTGASVEIPYRTGPERE